LGVKSKRGFFDYDDDNKETSDKGHTLIYLDIATNSISKIGVRGGANSIVAASVGQTPDGIQIDQKNGKMYWTIMGSPKENDGRICSANTDGTEQVNLIKPGSTHTPKQLQLRDDALYWCDREGGRIMSCKTDGSGLVTIYDSAPGEPRPLGDATKWCVGITVDTKRDLLYWTQKGPSKGGQGRMFRMKLGEEKADKIQTILDQLPEPIDLELDPTGETLYCMPSDAFIS
jgi:DNA-binding beta-propeller fold protein YncE